MNPDPISKNRTWLGHHVKKQCGTIDLMVLQGKYSIEEIAEEIDRISNIDIPFDARIKRVVDHLDHLQTGNSRGRASGMKPHKLRIAKGIGARGRMSTRNISYLPACNASVAAWSHKLMRPPRIIGRTIKTLLI